MYKNTQTYPTKLSTRQKNNTVHPAEQLVYRPPLGNTWGGMGYPQYKRIFAICALYTPSQFLEVSGQLSSRLPDVKTLMPVSIS